jgi:hypothetical protein
LLKEMVTKVVTRRSDGCSIVVTRVAPGCGDKGLLKDVVTKDCSRMWWPRGCSRKW